MSFRSIFLVGILSCFVGSLSCDDASAQLFPRLRRAAQSSNGYYGTQPYQYQRSSTFNANNYQYTQPAESANYVPSQPTQYQRVRLQDGRVVLMPVSRPFNAESDKSEKGDGQQIAENKNRTAQQRIQIVNYYDPNTGRMFQRRYLVPVANPAANATDVAESEERKRIADNKNRKPATAETIARSSFEDSNVQLLPLDTSPTTEATANFESVTKIPTSPNLTPTNSAGEVTYSIFEGASDAKIVAPQPTAKPVTKNSELEFDLPALNAAGEKGK